MVVKSGELSIYGKVEARISLSRANSSFQVAATQLVPFP